MQGSILAIIIGAGFGGLTLVAVALARQSDFPRMRLQIILGGIVGVGAAAAVLVMRTDLVPDSLEGRLTVALVIGCAIVGIPLLLRHGR